MKFKVTKKEMNENYYRILSIGYCELDYLLKNSSPIAYSTNVNGWSCDYYYINDVLISTGYSTIKSKNVNELNYEKIFQYNELAINANPNELEKLLNEFIYEVKS